ncbi:MAG: hypothetical protein NTW19_14720 [Planctomycetota bacterium]|nr:hypothetical protein [Planctomycetota bacterium]
MTTTLDLGPRRELFVDGALVDRLTSAARVLHAPERREVVWQTQTPWESSTSGYFNLFRDGGRICMYYRGNSHADDDASATTNLLESVDGVNFTRPNLGLIDFEGSRSNNIVFRGMQAHNFFAFRDDNPAAPADQRYKAVGGGWMKLFGLASPDGLRWRLIQQEMLDCKGVFDSLNVVHWDPERRRYRMFARWWDEGMKVRAIHSSESEDFIHWTEPQPFRYAPGVPLEHFYTNAVVPCPGAEQILLSFPMRLVPERTLSTEGMSYPGEGICDAPLMSSRDGRRIGCGG